MAVKASCIGGGQTVSLETIQHIMQSTIKDQFVEFDPDFIYLGQTDYSRYYTSEIPLQNIKGVPIVMLVS